VTIKFGWATRIYRHAITELGAPPSGTIAGLDLLRSVAILLVVSGHVRGAFDETSNAPLGISSFPLFLFSWTGVDLFFVLSGYLIGRQLWQQLARRGSIDVPAFLLRRGLRIWPFYFAFATWTIYVSAKPLTAFLPDLVFLSNYLHHQIGGGWSLSTEEQFYLLVPLLLLAAIARKVPITNHVFIPIIALAALPISRALTFAMHPDIAASDRATTLTYMPFHTHSDGLFAGLILAWLAVVKPNALAARGVLPNAVVPILLVITGLLVRQCNKLVFAFTALALIFGGVTLFMLRDRSIISSFARARPFYLLSRLSYGMYLNHFPLLDWGVPFLLHRMSSYRIGYAAFLLTWVLAIAASATISAVTFVLIESPFLQMRERWLSHRRAKPGIV
jgi:peptidoglycan/LPS O-acetylase OafA/YrhL